MIDMALLPGRRARQLVPALAGVAVAAPPGRDDLRWFMTSFLGGLVFFGTLIG